MSGTRKGQREGERWRNGQAVSSQNIPNMDQLSSPFYTGPVCGCPQIITVVTSKITDPRQITVTNIITILKNVETLQELPECDIETQSEQMLLEKWYQYAWSRQGCHKLSTGEECSVCKA